MSTNRQKSTKISSRADRFAEPPKIIRKRRSASVDQSNKRIADRESPGELDQGLDQELKADKIALLDQIIQDYVHDFIPTAVKQVTNCLAQLYNRRISLEEAARRCLPQPNQFGQTYYVRTEGLESRIVSQVSSLTASEILTATLYTVSDCFLTEKQLQPIPDWVQANRCYVPHELNKFIMVRRSQKSIELDVELSKLEELEELPTICPKDIYDAPIYRCDDLSVSTDIPRTWKRILTVDDFPETDDQTQICFESFNDSGTFSVAGSASSMSSPFDLGSSESSESSNDSPCGVFGCFCQKF